VFKGPHYELKGEMDEDAAAAQSNLSNMMQEWIPNQSTERLEELRTQMREDWSSMMSDAYDRFIEHEVD
jgi:hypothetical protein